MNTRTASFLVSADIALRAPDGSPIVVHAKSLDLLYAEDLLAECRLAFTVDPDVYVEIDRRALFHLEPEARLSGAEGFERDREVRIETRLERDLLAAFASPELTPMDASNIVQRLAVESPEDRLVATESWYALNVTQEIVLPEGLEGVLRAGFKTTWADPEVALSAPVTGDVEPESMLGRLIAYFEREGLEFFREEGERFIQSEFEGRNGSFELYGIAREDKRQIVVFTVCQKFTPEEQLPAMAELMARANHGLVSGNFELDFDDGEVRFRTSLDLGEDELTDAAIDRLLVANVSAMDLYLPAIEAVMAGEQTPVAAIEAIEAGSEE